MKSQLITQLKFYHNRRGRRCWLGKMKFLLLLLGVHAVSIEAFAGGPGTAGQEAVHTSPRYSFRFPEGANIPPGHHLAQIVRVYEGESLVETLPLEVRANHICLEARLPLDLDYRRPVPGAVLERVAYQVIYKGTPFTWDAHCLSPHSLEASWDYQEERDLRRNAYRLRLAAVDAEGTHHPLSEAQSHHILYEDHERLAQGPEKTGRYFWEQCSVTRAVSCQFKNPHTHAEYEGDVIDRTAPIPGHEGRTILYAGFFNPETQMLMPFDASCRGFYEHVRPLTESETGPYIREGQFIYSNGGGTLYLPHVTQQIWRNGKGEHIGAMIASYSSNDQLRRVPSAETVGGGIPEGLYQLAALREHEGGRVEVWKRPGDQESLELYIPQNVPLVPGMGLFTPYSVPLADDGAQLRHTFDEITSRLATFPSLQEGESAVCLIGPVGAGKSTLMNLLAGRTLHAVRKPGGGIKLEATDSVPDVTIAHTITQAGTKFPAAWYDASHKRLLIDCPGWGDPEGVNRDVQTLFTLYSLFAKYPGLKVLLVVDEGLGSRGAALKIFKEVATLFANEHELHAAVALVLMKQREVDLSETLGTIVSEFAPAASDPLESRRFQELIRFLAAHPERQATVPYPSQVGSYQGTADTVENALATCHPVPHPTFDLTLGGECRDRIRRVAEDLNTYLVRYMGTEGRRQLMAHCRASIDRHQGTVDEWRPGLLAVAQRLTSLQDVESPQGAVEILGEFIEGRDLNNAVDTLAFLQKLDPEIRFRVREWVDPLIRLAGQLEAIAQPPQVHHVEGTNTVHLHAAVLGMSDVCRVAADHPQCALWGQASHTVFLDQDIAHRGRNLVIVSPRTHLREDRRVDLSGTPGMPGQDGRAPGADGQPGGVGGNGGHFYLLTHTVTGGGSLTVDVSGGAGGRGGNGARGAPGRDGVDGVLQPTSTQPWLGPQITGHPNYWSRNAGTIYLYANQGTDGIPGQAGGRAGIGGMGGLSGTVLGTGLPLIRTEQQGPSGPLGQGGQGGAGGRHGSHCVGSKTVQWHHDEGLWNGKRVKHPTAQGSPRGEVPGDPPPGHQIRGHAPQGQAGQGVNPAGQVAPAPSAPPSHDAALAEYRRFYEQAAMDPVGSSFVSVFPELTLPKK